MRNIVIFQRKREREIIEKLVAFKNRFGSKNAVEAFTQFIYMIHIILSSVYIEEP